MGPSGSGKSTLVRLLLGFERPNTGTVTFDGKGPHIAGRPGGAGADRRGDAERRGHRRRHPLGDPRRLALTEAQAWQAAAQVDLADDIRALPMGMRTLLGDNAVTFSGGQRQRLVLASVIARNPRLVLLDEATSALDSVTQAHVARAFEKLQVTRVVVAHRLSTIRNADRIVVLDGGRWCNRAPTPNWRHSPGVQQDGASTNALRVSSATAGAAVLGRNIGQRCATRCDTNPASSAEVGSVAVSGSSVGR